MAKKIKHTTKNISPIIEKVLKKVYYNKYAYKLVVKLPKELTKVSEKERKQPDYAARKKIINREYSEFKKIQENITFKYYGKSYQTKYCVNWAGLKTYTYYNKVSMYFDNEKQFDDYRKSFHDWVLEIEKPLNEEHISIYNSEFKLNVEVRDRLYAYDNYQYKIIIPVYNSLKDIETLYQDIVDMFHEKKDTVDIKLNCYTITILTNDESDLMYVKLCNFNKTKIFKAVKTSEVAKS